jgi:hypothetical protein
MGNEGIKHRPSLPELWLRLIDDSVLLVRSEFSTLWRDVRTRLGQAAGSIALVVIGVMLVGMAFLFLLTGMLIWLSYLVGVVAAALIAGAIAIILGGLTLYVGLKRLQTGQPAENAADAVATGAAHPDSNDAALASAAKGD